MWMPREGEVPMPVCERESKKCTIIFFACPEVRGKGSDSAFGVRHSTTERNNSRQKLEDSTVAGNFNRSNIGAS